MFGCDVSKKMADECYCLFYDNIRTGEKLCVVIAQTGCYPGWQSLSIMYSNNTYLLHCSTGWLHAVTLSRSYQEAAQHRDETYLEPDLDNNLIGIPKQH